MSLHHILTIARKDLIDAVRNSYILVAIVLPAGLSLLLRVVFPANEDLTLKISVYDQNTSRFVTLLRARPDVQLTEAYSPEQVRERVSKEGLVGGLIIPSGFDAAVDADMQPELRVYVNSRVGIAKQVAFRLLIETEVWELVGKQIPVRVTFSDVSGADTQPGSGLGPEGMFLIMLLVMGLAIIGTFVVPLMVVEEKERQTLLALRVSPASFGDVVSGKCLVGFIYALLMALIIMTLNGGWAGLWPFTLLAVSLGALFVVLLGLLMGSLFNTITEVNTWSSIVVLVLMVPSWTTMMPVPEKLQDLLQLLPTYHLGQLIAASTSGQLEWGQAGIRIGILIVSIVIAFACAVWALQREKVQ